MNSLKFASLMIIILSVMLIVIGGLYNPNSVVDTIPPGQIHTLSFYMKSGERVNLIVRGTDYFTLYIFNESSYQNMTTGNFTSALFETTGEKVNITFTAPQTGRYYLVIANVNSPGFIQVTVEYGKANNLIVLALGIVAGAVSLLLIALDLKSGKKSIEYDARCPKCGSPVNSSWKFCPVCRQELGGDKK